MLLSEFTRKLARFVERVHVYALFRDITKAEAKVDAAYNSVEKAREDVGAAEQMLQAAIRRQHSAQSNYELEDEKAAALTAKIVQEIDKLPYYHEPA